MPAKKRQASSDLAPANKRLVHDLTEHLHKIQGAAKTDEEMRAARSKIRTALKRSLEKKRPRKVSAYMHFVKHRFADLKAQNKNKPIGELGKMLGKEWNNLSPEVRKRYEAQAEHLYKSSKSSKKA